MAESFDLDDFDNPPPPPRYLYKYLSVDRIGNVLEGRTVRFTPLMNTNDSFEVRSTFDKLAGPKFRQMLADHLNIKLSDNSTKEMISELLAERGIHHLSPEQVIELAEQHFGGQFEAVLHGLMNGAADEMVPMLNEPKYMDELLEKLGRELLCFSLSERMDSAPMWAHYADNNSGLVVAFDSAHDWFTRRKDGKRTRLQRVAYFDGKVEEPLQDVRSALISKTTDWKYEREWRLYVKEDQVDKIVGDASDPIHLLDFPSEAVNRVILGHKASEETTARVRAVLSVDYPTARIVRVVPNRANHTYDEVGI